MYDLQDNFWQAQKGYTVTNWILDKSGFQMCPVGDGYYTLTFGDYIGPKKFTKISSLSVK